jgi:hypothetical protein
VLSVLLLLAIVLSVLLHLAIVLSVLLHLVIVLSVLPRYTDSDYLPLVSSNSSSTQVYICYVLSEVLFVSFVNKNIFLGGLFILFGLKT